MEATLEPLRIGIQDLAPRRKGVVICGIPERNLVACRGRYYKRVASSNQTMGIEETARLHLMARNSSWDYQIRSGNSLAEKFKGEGRLKREGGSRSGRWVVGGNGVIERNIAAWELAA